jgi:hypothetical protein
MDRRIAVSKTGPQHPSNRTRRPGTGGALVCPTAVVRRRSNSLQNSGLVDNLIGVLLQKRRHVDSESGTALERIRVCYT